MNLIDVTREFSTDEKCLAYIEKMRWPNGVCCIKCGSVRVSKFTSKSKKQKVRHLYQCLEKACSHQFTATTGTIFHDTHLPLRKWFLALALILESKKGMSANQIKRHLGVQYRTAWHLCHRIRKAMEQQDSDLLTGTVEVDETYIGGKYDPRRKRAKYDKVPVIGMIERSGRVRAEIIANTDRHNLVGAIKRNVSPDALVMTDEGTGYRILKNTYRHETVNHIKGEYIRGDVSTNSIENFWSLLKRGIIGSFHKISEKHLERYLKEFCYRFNRRDIADLFSETLRNLVGGKRLSYKSLVAGIQAEG